MSTVNMLAEQSFARPNLVGSNEPVTTGPSPFSAPTAFSGDFLGLSLQDDENLWGLSPISTAGLPPTWAGNGRDQAFGNPSLERELKNSHVRNGQPTPPPFDDGNGKHSPDLYTLAQCQLDGTPPISLEQRHFGSDTTSASGMGISASASKRRRMSKHHRYSGMESDGTRQEKAKREKFLERNRLAASKCRQKKKEHTMLLETRYKEQSDKKEKLMAEIARLRSDLLALKNEVLKHAQCGDEPIKLHLAQMVKRIAYNDTESEVTDGGDPGSSSEDATTPIAAAAAAAQPPSFGFDDPLRSETQGGPGLYGARRDSESSLMSEGSYGFDDEFEELINV